MIWVHYELSHSIDALLFPWDNYRTFAKLAIFESTYSIEPEEVIEMTRNATYWEVAEGQLTNNERVHLGSPEETVAQKAAQDIPNVKVVNLRTIERDLAKDNPDFDPSDVFESHRWCLVHTV